MLSTKPTVKVIEDKIHMYVPYALNAPFRALFKTAAWLPSQKVFEASNTTSNMKKWQKFLDATASAQEKLVEAEHADATEAELVALKAAAQNAVVALEERIKSVESGITAAKKAIAIATVQQTELTASLEEAEARLEAQLKLQAEAQEARDSAIAPVLTLYAKHDLDDILMEFRKAARRNYAGKESLGRAQERLVRLVKDLSRVGYKVEALNALCEVSLNRHDKVPNLVDAADHAKLSGVVAVKQPD